MPTTPQYAAGIRIDPLLSVPTEPKINDALTAAAEPPLEPPGTQLSFQGLWTCPKADFTQVPPIAHSWRLFLPTMTEPAARRRATTVASYSVMLSVISADAFVVGQPATAMLSLIPTGKPCHGPR